MHELHSIPPVWPPAGASWPKCVIINMRYHVRVAKTHLFCVIQRNISTAILRIPFLIHDSSVHERAMHSCPRFSNLLPELARIIGRVSSPRSRCPLGLDTINIAAICGYLMYQRMGTTSRDFTLWDDLPLEGIRFVRCLW